MQDISKLCMICLSIKDDNDICPRCKKRINVSQDTPLLPLKSILSERYCVAKAIKRNGEGVTYAAYDLQTEKPVSIREFFPEAIVSRSLDELTVVPSAGSETYFSRCRADFIELWTKLTRLKGLTALVTVVDVFQANSTAYAVYEESEMLTLSAYLRTFDNGCIPWEKARILFMPVLSTLGTLHTTGILHRGINPSSFIFSKDGKLKLTDFSIEAARTAYGDLQPEIYDGYAPLEQYAPKNMMGTWSDIYSFCAVLYRSLIGARPIDAKTRAEDDKMMIPARFAEILPGYVINSLINGMQVYATDRTQTVEQLRDTLSAVGRTVGATSGMFSKPSPEKYTPKKDDDDNFESFGEEPVGMPDKEEVVRTHSPIERNDTLPLYTPADETEASEDYDEEPVQEIRTETPEERRRKYEMLRRRREADERLERENEKKKKLLIIMCAVLAVLVIGVGFAFNAVIHANDESDTSVSDNTGNVPEEVKVVNFIGLNIDDVIDNPQYTDMYKLRQESEDNPSAAAGTIMRQSVDADTMVERGTMITLTVSSGVGDVQVPSVIGLTYNEAEAKLVKLHLKCTKSGVVNTGDGVPDTVKEVVPSTGTTVKQGSSVTVVVWLPEEVDPSDGPVIDLENEEAETSDVSVTENFEDPLATTDNPEIE